MAEKTFGTRLRELRELRGMSRADLAEAAGMEPSAISHWETDRREPTLSNMLRLADALRLTPGNLLPKSQKQYAVCPNCGGHGLVMQDRATSPLR